MLYAHLSPISPSWHQFGPMPQVAGNQRCHTIQLADAPIYACCEYVKRIRKRLFDWSMKVWLYSRPFRWIIWLVIVIATVALAALIAQGCQLRGAARDDCGLGSP
jgi:hypothetical protein